MYESAVACIGDMLCWVSESITKQARGMSEGYLEGLAGALWALKKKKKTVIDRTLLGELAPSFLECPHLPCVSWYYSLHNRNKNEAGMVGVPYNGHRV